MFAVEVSDTAIVCGTLGPILVTLVTGIVIWLKASAAVKGAQAAVLEAQVAALKADASHKVVSEIKDIAIKTEQQTNNRLSELDKKVQEHEIKCIDSRRREAELQRQLAELKLALVEAQIKGQNLPGPHFKAVPADPPK